MHYAHGNGAFVGTFDIYITNNCFTSKGVTINNLYLTIDFQHDETTLRVGLKVLIVLVGNSSDAQRHPQEKEESTKEKQNRREGLVGCLFIQYAGFGAVMVHSSS